MNDEQGLGLRVKSVHVKKLFGMYDHDIVLKSEERTTIIFGRNGAGKTVIFKLIHALLGGDASTLTNLLKYPYEEFRVVFSNDDQAIVKRLKGTGPVHKELAFGNVKKTSIKSEDSLNSVHLQMMYVEFGIKNKEKSIEINASLFVKAAEKLERRLPIHQVAPKEWFDPETSESMDAFQVVEKFGSWGKDDIFSAKYLEWRTLLASKQVPQTLFIQAQRLIQVKSSISKRFIGEDRQTIRDTVLEYSADLKKRIDQTLAEYGREAQRLDQTYPQRLLGKTEPPMQVILETTAIQHALKNMKDKQEEYQNLGILGDQAQAPNTDQTTGGEVEGVYRAAMTLYVQDTQKKLLIIDELAQRIKLLLETIRDKFSNKELRIDPKTHDLIVKSTTDDRQELTVSALSSGEQHQLVLTYDLLFRTKANTLVLIDEPELSLHMEWQERFLSDLKAVIDLVHFDALLATHSPYIVNGHNDLMVGLSVKVE